MAWQPDRSRFEGKDPKARIEAIEVGLGQRVNIAEPGRNVRIRLRGMKKGQISKGVPNLL